MRLRACTGIVSIAALLAAAGCAKSTTTPTVTTSAPVLLTPANGSSVANTAQPVILVVQNAAGSTGGTTYTFEVATDVAFTAKVQTKDGIAEGSGGRTQVQLDSLLAAKDYYWRAKATPPGGTGTFSDLFKFTVGAAISLSAPTPISPLNATETIPRPVLRVNNVGRSATAGPLTYKFEIARDSSFNSILVSGTNSEGVNETGFIVTSDLPAPGSFAWRATAIDSANNISSAPSQIQVVNVRRYSQAESVANQLGVTVWPAKVPPNSTGHATMGENWQIQTLTYRPENATFQSPDLEMLRIFDLLDRGFDPDGAIGWMQTNGYPTAALWYPPPEKAVIGLHYVYLASRNKITVNGTWDVVLRVE